MKTLDKAMFLITMGGSLNDEIRQVQLVHVHLYDQKVAEYKYIIKKATCEDKAIYSYSCTCGEKGGDYFELR